MLSGEWVMGCLGPNPEDTDFFQGSWISYLGSYKELQWEIATTTKCFPPYPFFSFSIVCTWLVHLTCALPGFFSFTLPFPPENATNSHPTFAQKTCRFICVPKPGRFAPSKLNINAFSFCFLEPLWSSIPCQTVHQLTVVQYFCWAAGQGSCRAFWNLIWILTAGSALLGDFSCVSGRNPHL